MSGIKLTNNINNFAKRNKKRRKIKETRTKLTGKKLRFKCFIIKLSSLLRIYGTRRLNML